MVGPMDCSASVCPCCGLHVKDGHSATCPLHPGVCVLCGYNAEVEGTHAATCPALPNVCSKCGHIVDLQGGHAADCALHPGFCKHCGLNVESQGGHAATCPMNLDACSHCGLNGEHAATCPAHPDVCIHCGCNVALGAGHAGTCPAHPALCIICGDNTELQSSHAATCALHFEALCPCSPKIERQSQHGDAFPNQSGNHHGSDVSRKLRSPHSAGRLSADDCQGQGILAAEYSAPEESTSEYASKVPLPDYVSICVQELDSLHWSGPHSTTLLGLHTLSCRGHNDGVMYTSSYSCICGLGSVREVPAKKRRFMPVLPKHMNVQTLRDEVA